MRHFPYIKQNSIAEIVSTMESFFALEMGFDMRLKKAKCEHSEGLFAIRRSDATNDAIFDLGFCGG